jgi:hypothetical protein
MHTADTLRQAEVAALSESAAREAVPIKSFAVGNVQIELKAERFRPPEQQAYS